ncbi:type VI secretion system contractile sheath large subunit [Shinella sp. 838]|jgi:type VI secretion system protein ImpD|uniref:type VI secretion system contractile sheath large subunit n=1 Tax=unclassified Shinella TaxID=2643062 RepID=UPI0003C53E72|nr:MULTISPECIES: type VI secretion system contractile sheath large subunit [unclassified Shinella]EYR83977.1 type VI secretion protein, EvpB/VC_A0108 family [Shinella sp. DD12]MDG4673215.1 type VI secretion system contractile sheath large subunit [Shinella sp. 838]
MHEDDAIAAGHASGGDGATGEAGLRLRIVDAVLGRGGDAPAAALDRFLDCEDPDECLRLWFGPRKGGDRWRAVLTRDIAAIDPLLGDQIDAIIHTPDFKALEASWRGVDLLLSETGNDDKVRVKLFNATWAELSRDFDRAIEFDQSTLFAKVYSEEYGMPGGVPYGLLLCDHAVRHRAPGGQDDVGTLTGLAQVAAAAFSPCILGAAPELFGVTTFADLSYAQRLDAGFQLGEYHRWRRLRDLEDSRFLGIAMPRVLLRDRYRDSASRQDGFRYSEGGAGVDSWLWGNAAFAFGVIAIRAFRDWGWFADMCGTRGPEGDLGGVVDHLPAPNFSTGEAIAYRRPLEVELTDKKQKILEGLGFIALTPRNFDRSVVFLGAQSLYAAPNDGDLPMQVNGRLSSMLHYVMCMSRFAHYVKIMARDRVGAYTTPQDLERYLEDWLRNYTIGNTDAGPELKARYPLAGARLEMSEVSGRPGVMNCVLHLQPHFQFDQVVSGFRMRTEVQAMRSR